MVAAGSFARKSITSKKTTFGNCSVLNSDIPVDKRVDTDNHQALFQINKQLLSLVRIASSGSSITLLGLVLNAKASNEYNDLKTRGRAPSPVFLPPSWLSDGMSMSPLDPYLKICVYECQVPDEAGLKATSYTKCHHCRMEPFSTFQGRSSDIWSFRYCLRQGMSWRSKRLRRLDLTSTTLQELVAWPSTVVVCCR